MYFVGSLERDNAEDQDAFTDINVNWSVKSLLQIETYIMIITGRDVLLNKATRANQVLGG